MGVHMSNYIGSPLRLYQAAPHLFGNVKGAERVQALYFEVFPKIKAWQQHTCELAERQTYIRSPFGVPHRFYQVYTYKKNEDSGEWGKVMGEDAKRCVAYNPQHTAAGIMRRAIRELGDTPARQYLRLTIHDELLWECPTESMEEVDETVRRIMEAPNRHLKLDPTWNMGEYLTIKTEGKYGTHWKEMK
jgi:DNA polymerase I-like protein with 3'-5' exonuclease and polymerase domains